MKPARLLSFLIPVLLLSAEEQPYPKAKVDFHDYKNLVAEVESHRATRLIDFNTFLEMRKQPGVIVLDTRSKFRFDRIHLEGATHLNFSDFTAENLRRLIPDPETTVLIYCNNNFDGNQTDFASKVAMPRSPPGDIAGEQLSVQAKPLMLALNIPTYLNLYGYGYRNVYELHELVNVNDPRVTFEGSIVNTATPSSLLPREKP